MIPHRRGESNGSNNNSPARQIEGRVFCVPCGNADQTTKGTKPMAVKLIANYAKRLGLPGYSSHQFSVSVETELQNVTDVAGESARLYESLQKAVDEQMQQTGFVPPDGYGMNGETNGNGHQTARSRTMPESRRSSWI